MSEQQSTAPATASGPLARGPLAEVGVLFLRLGFTAFGGPAAHIAMMREEVVRRRGWLRDAHFLDLVGEVNLLPGPGSTQLALYLGYLRAGWAGLLLAGVCFIGPAMLIVLALAWAYVTFGGTPQVSWLLYGIKPVVIAIIVQALWGLGRAALVAPPGTTDARRSGFIHAALSLVSLALFLALYLLGLAPLGLLFGGAVGYGLARALLVRPGASEEPPVPPREKEANGGKGASLRALLPLPALVALAAPVSLLTLFLTFLKIGAVLYGSGYVLLAFLRADFVEGLRWLTDRQVLDAVAIGQFTPGPVFTTATFIGYLVGGVPGALLATLAIFLPSFAYVPLIHRLSALLRRSRWTAAMLSGANIAALALMAGVTFQLAQAALVDVLTWMLALGALVVLLRVRLNSAWLIAVGALLGALARGVGL